MSSAVTPAAIFWIGSGGGLLFVLCACWMVRCFRRCGEAQRRALRDHEYELVGGGRVRPRRYSRLPVTDAGIFVGLPAQ